MMAKWINWGKTKVMVVQRGGGTGCIVVDGVEVEQRNIMAMFNKERSCNDEIENRIGVAARIVGH